MGIGYIYYECLQMVGLQNARHNVTYFMSVRPTPIEGHTQGVFSQRRQKG